MTPCQYKVGHLSCTHVVVSQFVIGRQVGSQHERLAPAWLLMSEATSTLRLVPPLIPASANTAFTLASPSVARSIGTLEIGSSPM